MEPTVTESVYDYYQRFNVQLESVNQQLTVTNNYMMFTVLTSGIVMILIAFIVGYQITKGSK